MPENKGLSGLVSEWRGVEALPSSARWHDSKRKAADELQPFLERLDRVTLNLLDDAHEMESPFYSKTPAEPDWNYVAKAFDEIAAELRSILHGEQPAREQEDK